MTTKTYAHHKPSPMSVAKIQLLRLALAKLHETIEGLAPPSRERAVALTNLETTAMWAIKAIVVNDPDAEIEQL